MVKPTNKSLSQLQSQEHNLEGAITKYNGAPKLVRAEQITEAQIRAKGGKPTDTAKVSAIKRRMSKNGTSHSPVPVNSPNKSAK